MKIEPRRTTDMPMLLTTRQGSDTSRALKGIRVFGAMLAGWPLIANAQFPPDEFTNLQVLPEDIEVRELIDKMRGFALGLGVRCTHCHVGEEGAPLSTFDFASDEKEEKEIARRMLRMVAEINGDHLDGLPRRADPPVEVRCETCHRGQTQPRLIEDVLEIELASGGPAAAVAEYRRLRSQHYGAASFDFSQAALQRFIQELLRGGRHDAALAMAALNDDLHPRNAQAQFLLGEVRSVMADNELAVLHYRNAVELDPGHALARRRLEALEGSVQQP